MREVVTRAIPRGLTSHRLKFSGMTKGRRNKDKCDPHPPGQQAPQRLDTLSVLRECLA